jgi:hypothetical protein
MIGISWWSDFFGIQVFMKFGKLMICFTVGTFFVSGIWFGIQMR